MSDLSTMRALLDRARSLHRRACRHVREHASGDPLDTAQVELYDLAFSAAELEACAVAIDYAATETTDAGMREQVAATFCAEAFCNLSERLGVRATDYGIHAGELDFGQHAFSAVARSSARLASLGDTFVARHGAPLSDDLQDDKAIIRRTFRQFADDVVAPLAPGIHREDGHIPDGIIEGLKSLGCFGLSVPERFGGLNPDEGDDSLGMVVVTEELSRGSLGAAGSLITRPEIVARALIEGGTDAQRQRWLPALAAGEPLCAVSVTEPSTGSDVASVSLRATRVEGGWRLNGGKTWCTFAGKAGVILVLARTEPDARPPHRGLSLFLVEKPSVDAHEFDHSQSGGGRISGRAIATLGYRGMHSYEMFYDDFFVPDANVVGEAAGLGKGFYYTMRGFAGGRLQTAARAVGLMQAAFERAIAYGSERRAFDRPVAAFPLTLAKYARMGSYITVCREFTYAAARLMDQGKAQAEASLVKLLACKVAEWVTREAMQIHGGMGYAEESDVSRYWVDARVLSIFEGAEETLAIRVVGKALLEGA